jgi:hypothetical protein
MKHQVSVYRHLMLLIAREHFIEFSHCRSFRSYNYGNDENIYDFFMFAVTVSLIQVMIVIITE